MAARSKRVQQRLTIIRGTPGIDWLKPYARMTIKEKKAILGPFVEKIEDSQARKAAKAFMELSSEELAATHHELWKLFNWDVYSEYLCRYMREWRAGMRKQVVTG